MASRNSFPSNFCFPVVLLKKRISADNVTLVFPRFSGKLFGSNPKVPPLK